MRIVIANGNPEPAAFDSRVQEYAAEQEKQGHSVKTFLLRDMDIGFCTGCWVCWLKTPGRCSRKDDMEILYPEIVHTDLLVYASPLILGTMSYLVKKVQDRCIPLIHPYIEIVQGEMHHRRRYGKNPDMMLLVECGELDTQEDLDLVRRMHARLSINMRGTFKGMISVNRTGKETWNETIAA
jgi:multimeric flavodoxin WrbA